MTVAEGVGGYLFALSHPSVLSCNLHCDNYVAGEVPDVGKRNTSSPEVKK